MADAQFAIELKGISKAFGPVQANKDINIAVPRGTIHGIIGENGAGKSTLMSILYGFYKADAGQIFINGNLTAIPDSQSAIRAGIGMVFQHFKLVQNFTVLENVILGAEDGPMLNTSLARARKVLGDLSREYELDVDPDALIEDLSVGHQQRVEILKALYRQADILILDEPTGVLTPDEADHLFRILKGLKDQGKTVILITHKLREIMETTDNVSVMRRGTMVATVKTAESSPESLAELMVGRKVLLEVEKGPAKPGAVVLSVQDLKVRDEHKVERLKGVSFDIRAGEILGIAGVAGNGQSELLAALGGMVRATGRIMMNGADLPLLGKGSDGQSRGVVMIGGRDGARRVYSLRVSSAAVFVIVVARASTTAPGMARWTPLTMTRSLAARPERTTRMPFRIGPTSSALDSTVPLSATTSAVLAGPADTTAVSGISIAS